MDLAYGTVRQIRTIIEYEIWRYQLGTKNIIIIEKVELYRMYRVGKMGQFWKMIKLLTILVEIENCGDNDQGKGKPGLGWQV